MRRIENSLLRLKNNMAAAPCFVGDSINDVETPSLLVCMDKLEKNMRRMAQIMKEHPTVSLRPHGKAHKCVSLAKIQMQNGAVGLCCQTLSEAEAMVNGGIKDVFVSNQVIGKKKTKRLASLAQLAKLSVCVDDSDNVNDLSDAAKEDDITLDLVVEVNVGQDRCGVEPGDVVDLTKQILSLPNISFKGIQCYNGWNQHVRSKDDREAAVKLVVDKTSKAIQILKDNGIECTYVTGGGTGTFHFEASSGVFTEIQPGSYLFMDADYNQNLNSDGNDRQEFEQALFLLTTVQSASGTERAVLDAGLKAVSLDSGVPLVKRAGEVSYVFENGGDEHGIVRPRGDLKVGDQVWLEPGHCDPTVNMHDWLVGLRNGKVECIWPVEGRGPGV